MTRIDCLRAVHHANGGTYPLFIGFMTAKDLSELAVAPHFNVSTPHEVIAGNILATPVREWQRPVNPERVREIARIFSHQQEIMPNAVLLAAPDPSRIDLTCTGGSLWTLDVKPQAEEPPLWILDGQHRIAGLSQVAPTGEIPFVLLAGQGASSTYQESTFAKIFAQVTTTAEGLHPLHDEWLRFAFNLGKYDEGSLTSGIRNERHVQSMRAVVELCHQRYLDDGATRANPFFDRIAFNPKSTARTSSSPIVGPTSGGFTIDAVAFEGLIHRSYFGSRSNPGGELSPLTIARNLGLAYEALVECHKTSQRLESVFLNQAGSAGSKGHKALQEGFLHGVLRHLAVRGEPADWPTVLRQRAFDTSDWRYTSWATGSRSGSEGTLNKKLARSVFEHLLVGDVKSLFSPAATAPASVNLADYFKGDVGWGIEVQARRRNAAGRMAQYSHTLDRSTTLQAGTSKSYLRIGTHRTLSVGATTSNILAVEIADVARPFERNWTYKALRAGLDLKEGLHLHVEPEEIRFDLTFYGGVRKDVVLAIQWRDDD